MKFRRLAVLITFACAAALGAPGLAAAAPPDRATGWLERQLVGGDHLETEFGGTSYPDAGLTIDAVFAFASAHSAGQAGGRAMAWLSAPATLSAYIGDGTSESYAGATAKTALAAEVRGLDPAAFGGVDLTARLRALLTPSGRFSDHSAYGDYSNAFSQSLAIVALHRAPGGAPSAAAAFLAGTQCADGGFPLELAASPCVSDTDSTAMAVQALRSAGRAVPARSGLAWLAGRQQANGGLSVGTGDPAVAPNANTTGLAGQALHSGGRPAAASRAKKFLLGLQVVTGDNAGAIAYTAAGFDPATAVRATTQAVLGLGGCGFAELSSAGSNPA
ncbi:peptidase [Amycolatopsis sp. PS_44_ISF1]|uniref:peptidase n=1 Tax=Amycolatopsis sp. PS_44_ISF1 TaxID=2974917 RepID=UPI0028DF74FB|nr:peptidase [Amycolatopsis sp. PS_44_ISF1]MDT8913238.1 peptidase [Amycolatopsis sp. PS_44_ISF1]